MTVIPPDRLEFRQFPGRSTADPFRSAGRGQSTVRQVVIDHVPARSPHRHPHSEEIVYVVSGRGRVWVEGAFHPVGPGSWYRIPAGSAHATMADPGESMSLVCFFPHEDFASNIEELDLIIEDEEDGDG